MKARDLAFKVLRRIDRDEAYSSLALNHELARSNLEANDKRLATELVYGVLRRRTILDHWIAWLTRRPVKKIDGPVLDVLRLALYQLLYLEKIPDHAILFESGKTLKKIKFGHAVGFCNAALRRFQRERVSGNRPALPDQPLKKIALEEGLPEWIVQGWEERERRLDPTLDEKSLLIRLQQRAEATNYPASIVLCANLAVTTTKELIDRIAQAGGRAEPGYGAETAVRVTEGGLDCVSPLIDEGKAWVMDEAAQLAASLLPINEGDTVLDLCAAPGGKSLFALARLGGTGRLVSVDIHPGKLDLLIKQARICGLDNLQTITADATKPIDGISPASFDAIILDAPCTALGLLRRQPDIRHRRKPEDIPKAAELQKRLITRAVDYLKPGGTLLFAVCSDTKEEGWDQLEWILKEFEGESLPLEKIPSKYRYPVSNGRLFDCSGETYLDGFQAFLWRKP